MRKAEGQRAGEHGERRRFDGGEPRPQDHQDAGNAEHHCGDARRGQLLAQKYRREYRGPKRCREFDREYGGERNQPDRVKPAELAAEVDQVARDVQLEMPEPQLREAATRQQQGDEHDAEAAAHHQHLEGAHVVREFARRHCHRSKGKQRARHPEDAAGDGGAGRG